MVDIFKKGDMDKYNKKVKQTSKIDQEKKTEKKEIAKGPEKTYEKSMPKEVFEQVFKTMDQEFKNLLRNDINLTELRAYLERNNVRLSISNRNPNINIQARDSKTQKLETIKTIPTTRFLHGEDIDTTGFKNSVYLWLNYTYLPAGKEKEAKNKKETILIESYKKAKETIGRTFFSQKELFPGEESNMYLNTFFK
jgi:hypothetical protein